MKKMILQFCFISMFATLPTALTAQWNMVRFDEYNYFNKAFTALPQTVFVSGMNSGPGSFIMRSNDGGLTWDSIPFSGLLSSATVLDLNFTDTDHGFAGGLNNTNQVLMATSDNGSTWTDITPDPNSALAVNSISFLDPLQGFASTESTLYKTTDGGATWINTPLAFTVVKIAFTGMADGFACGTENNLAAVLKTTDGGLTWNNLLSVSNPFMTIGSMSKVDVVNSNVVISSLQYSNKLFKTVDGGLSWDTISITPIFSIQDFDFISANQGHVLSTMGEIYGTVDGGLTWNLEYAVAGGVYGPSVFLNSLSFSGTTGYVCGSNGLIKRFTPESTGLGESSSFENLSVFPNPVGRNTSVSILGLTGEFTLELTDPIGKIILHQQFNSAGELIQLPVGNNAANGIYTLNIRNNNKSLQKKIVVCK